jgi:hypothetical protein
MEEAMRNRKTKSDPARPMCGPCQEIYPGTPPPGWRKLAAAEITDEAFGAWRREHEQHEAAA